MNAGVTIKPGPVANVVTLELTTRQARLIHALLAPTTGDLGYSIYSPLDDNLRGLLGGKVLQDDLDLTQFLDGKIDSDAIQEV